jgi:hypothetical protein
MKYRALVRSGGRRFLLLAAAACLAGCGYDEYEAKMLKEQERLKKIDEEELYLGEPAKIIVRGEQAGSPPLEAFFRLPRGVEPRTDNGFLGEVMVRYPRVPTQYGYRSAKATKEPEPLFQEVFIGVMPPGDFKEFSDKILLPFQSMQRSEVTRVTKSPPGRQRLEFQTITFNDGQPSPTKYHVYILQAPQGRAAIAYRVPYDKQNSPEVQKAIDVSLPTLAFGAEAAALKQKFKPKT